MAARFDAFISYSRRASSALAVELRNGVERFAKPWNKLRSSRVFLDDASMSANTGLWSNIEKGLTEAEWFILLASPASAASEYVTTEIRWWREHKSADRILLVLDEGDILWDAVAGLLVASLVATVIAVVNGNVATEQARIAQARQ
ncbi:MAG: toll/interleukin-1 receptor domain-containing protein, partial [Rhodoglobus sp.]